ncbi:MAG: aminotransferase class I/II-fold pyridoxal phosphate-dependent enzyme, partial [Acidobacteria bacterium]|nr:aminotransferase class I/II-fold pyridoxal phosphate-dependent enzyme [Acidobacteriota bacterium]
AGGGTAEHFGVHGGVDIQIGTLSKALAAVGGFIASSRPVVELIRQRARPFLFSAALPPAVAASVTAAMDIMATEPERQARLWENTRYFKGELVRLGFDIGMSETPITPVILGDSKRAQHMSQLLEDAGVLATPIVYPMVPEPKARIRTIVMATHSREELAHAIDAFERIGRSLGVSS